MNNAAAIEQLNEDELRLGLAGGPGSWHARYAHSAVVYVGGLDSGMTEGDILTVFEQVGTIDHINVVRDAESGRPKGFCFLRYVDQRSSVLAVDNFNAVKLFERTLRVDHVDDYKVPEEGTAIDLDNGLAPERTDTLTQNSHALHSTATQLATAAETQVSDRIGDGSHKAEVLRRLQAIRKSRVDRDTREMREGARAQRRSRRTNDESEHDSDRHGPAVERDRSQAAEPAEHALEAATSSPRTLSREQHLAAKLARKEERRRIRAARARRREQRDAAQRR